MKFQFYVVFSSSRFSENLIKVRKESLYYLAPEIMRELGTPNKELQFSEESDIYAFGYEF